VQTFTALITAQKMPFAFETVFSLRKRQADGSYQSKAEVILQLKRAGYFVVLLFVGLANVELSILRVQTRLEQGGHAVPENKLRERYPRTLLAIRHAAALAHTTLMYDNSRSRDKAFSLARAQRASKVLYDCREDSPATELSRIAELWLRRAAPPLPS
jgi:predicted ABC-type ATPase